MTTELHGVTGAPYNTPQVRKKLPAPFTRPRIDLDGGRHLQRSWKDTPVTEIVKGDIVADVGRIEAVVESIKLPDPGELGPLDAAPWRVRLYNVMGEYFDFSGHQRLYAFTVDPAPS